MKELIDNILHISMVYTVRSSIVPLLGCGELLKRKYHNILNFNIP